MVARPRLGPPGSGELPPEPLPTAPPAPLVIPRGVQLVLLLVALLALWVAARAAKHVVEIIIVASFIALVLNPFVEFLGRRGLRRGLAIPLAYISLLLILAGIGLALAQPISNQVDAFQHNFPHLVVQANEQARRASSTSSTSTASTSSCASRGTPRSTRSSRRC